MVRRFILYSYGPQIKTIALVVGANDLGRSSTAHIAEEVMKDLCFQLHSLSPQSFILKSEMLPRGRDLFHEQKSRRIATESIFLEEWNAVAAEVNCRLHELAGSVDWLHIISQWQFHSMFGAHRRLRKIYIINVLRKKREQIKVIEENNIVFVPQMGHLWNRDQTVPSIPLHCLQKNLAHVHRLVGVTI
ncbi:hypothetical protein DPMN_000788 [Dreissena polymorpha]|uniref:Uncharacterized protein n=1 Tax=Dreissena polymorpha TaxID=45954 RepID=A0A9D4MGI6_DREPO|nr:hypothetical protein DPMN_000788 [Dreissena polymorpha]